jgi:hypothetical protein
VLPFAFWLAGAALRLALVVLRLTSQVASWLVRVGLPVAWRGAKRVGGWIRSCGHHATSQKTARHVDTTLESITSLACTVILGTTLAVIAVILAVLPVALYLGGLALRLAERTLCLAGSCFAGWAYEGRNSSNRFAIQNA